MINYLIAFFICLTYICDEKSWVDIIKLMIPFYAVIKVIDLFNN